MIIIINSYSIYIYIYIVTRFGGIAMENIIETNRFQTWMKHILR